MHDRVIENWLTNANELSFTIPFAQVLALQGHRIVLIQPKKSTLEQGKDVITVGPDDAVHCYQLKGDDITLNRWRTEVKPEIEAMTDIPPKHPSLGDVDEWICHLVVNGEFRGDAAREVYDIQQERAKKGLRNFDTIMRGDLFGMFTAAYGAYLPATLEDFAAFLEQYNADGKEPANKLALSKILEAAFADLLGHKTTPSKNAIRQRITASVITMSYLLVAKYRAKNHIAVAEGWLLLLGYILAIAEKASLDKEYWQPSANLIRDVVDETFAELLDELDQRTHYAEPGGIPYADAYVYRHRVTIVAGYLAASCLSAGLRQQEKSNDDRVAEYLIKAGDMLIVWGEGAIPLLMMVAAFWQQRGETDRAAALLLKSLDAILAAFETGGLHDPYADVQDVIRTQLALTLKPLEQGAQGSSYLMEPLILMLAGLNERHDLEQRWAAISHISQIQFKPDPVWRWFYWRSAHGSHESRFLPQQQSWTELKARAGTADNQSALPEVFSQDPSYLPPFLCVMPHRTTPAAIRSILTAARATEA